MERFVTDEHTGLKYELVGDYYLIAGEDEPEEREPVAISRGTTVDDMPIC